MRLQCQRMEVGRLSGAKRDRMYAMFQRHYQGTDRQRFEIDLDEKHFVLLLSCPESKRLCGFSTQRVDAFEFDHQRYQVIFSGDTIIEPAYWGDTALIRHWGRMVADVLIDAGDSPVIWFLISKGFRTYRFLPVFFSQFYPRYDTPTPARFSQLRDALAHSRFGNAYDADAGIIRATERSDWLRDDLGRIETARLSDPHIRFFLEQNPQHARGDELCCLTPVSWSNFTRAGIRLLDPELRTLARTASTGNSG